MRLTVKDIMTVEPITIRPDLPFKEVVHRLIEHNIGGLPVIDEQGDLVGIVTETDLITKPAYGEDRRGLRAALAALLMGQRPSWLHKASGRSAQEIMSSHVLSATPTETLAVVARRLVEHRIGRLPVVDGEGRLVGIVSRRDLLRQFHRTDEEIAAELDKALHSMAFEEAYGVSFSINEGIVTLTGTVTSPLELTTLQALVGCVPGVVGIQNEVSARLPEPHPEPSVEFPEDPYIGRPI